MTPRATAEDDIPPPPDGFVLSGGRGAFTSHNGPYFHRPVESGAEQAFYALKRHCNGVGLIHGGMLSAFLDGLLAGAAARGTGAVPITIHLSVDYLDMGRAGEWVLGEARVTRATRDIAFVEGRAHVGGRDLARAHGVFKLMKRRPLDRP
ncbi:PaaI family thioesterase [Caulobacter sp. KR2-114]|uniref:PaaI family thioesterase n=1 Tax=Caulobacter sp. KR2-114 TaxID=3400912 RepID=UPI003C039171